MLTDTSLLPDRNVVVALGAGHWVETAYEEPLENLQKGDAHQVFVAYWLPDSEVLANPELLIRLKRFVGWHARCLNVAQPDQLKRLLKLRPDAVFVATPDATHVREVREWIPKAQEIYVEKPFDVNPDTVRRLRRDVDARKQAGLLDTAAISGIDHYLIRATPVLTLDGGEIRLKPELMDALGGDVTHFTFYMTESHDENLVSRKSSLQGGMIMDLGSHAVAMVIPFGIVGTIERERVKPGVFSARGAMTINGREIFVDGRETFAQVEFEFLSYNHRPVSACLTVGKEVGSEDDKRLVVRGLNGRTLTLNFAAPYSAELVEEDGTPIELQDPLTLLDKPITYLIENVFSKAPEAVPAFNLWTAQRIIKKLAEMTEPISDFINPELDVRLTEYPAGTSLHEILDLLEWME